MTNVSLFWPQLVPARALRIFSRFPARSATRDAWVEKVRWGPGVTPRILGVRTWSRGSLPHLTPGSKWDW